MVELAGIEPYGGPALARHPADPCETRANGSVKKMETQAQPLTCCGMRRVAHSLYLLPARPGHKRPHVSRWKMTAEEAAALGAISVVPDTTEILEIPETEEETLRATMHYPSAGHDSVKPPQKGKK